MGKITGIILAGGRSSRMGQDKGLIQLNGKSLIQYVIDTLNRIDIPILIVANNPAYAKFEERVVSDIHSDKGPVGGIYSGLINSDTESNIILGCDAPFVPPELIQHILSLRSNPATIVQYDQKIYPLIGYYNRNVLPSIEKAIKMDQLKLTELCSAIDSTILDLSEHPSLGKEDYYANLNTFEDLKRYER